LAVAGVALRLVENPPNRADRAAVLGHFRLARRVLLEQPEADMPEKVHEIVVGAVREIEKFLARGLPPRRERREMNGLLRHAALDRAGARHLVGPDRRDLVEDAESPLLLHLLD